MLTSTTGLPISGQRFVATYTFTGPHTGAAARAEAACVEQTIEFPADLVPDDDIRRHVIGQVDELDPVGPDTTRVRISYAVETAGGELPQLLNVLFGNTSLQRKVRLDDVELPEALLTELGGARYGVDGLRKLLHAPDRPLLATALKPMGLPPERLAAMAGELALGGIDLIKDDHGLANQPFACFEERVRACAQAVRDAAERTGHPTIYLPSLNGPIHELEHRLQVALDAGATGLLVLAGLTGFDHMRELATRDGIALPIMGHPAFLGGFVSCDSGGIAPELLFGKLMRLAGADTSIFPNHGGRFGFSRDACLAIAQGCAAHLGHIPAAFPTPGGGMRLDRVEQAIDDYGTDVMLLIGGDLHRGDDLAESVARFRKLVER